MHPSYFVLVVDENVNPVQRYRVGALSAENAEQTLTTFLQENQRWGAGHRAIAASNPTDVKVRDLSWDNIVAIIDEPNVKVQQFFQPHGFLDQGSEGRRHAA